MNDYQGVLQFFIFYGFPMNLTQMVEKVNFKVNILGLLQVEVNGNNAAPLYKFLKSEKGGFLINGIKWNFTKFLVNKEGKVIERYSPRTPPLEIEVSVKKNHKYFRLVFKKIGLLTS